MKKIYLLLLMSATAFNAHAQKTALLAKTLIDGTGKVIDRKSVV